MAIEALGKKPGLFKFHLALSLGSWITVVPVDIIERGSVSLFTPILSLLTIPLFCEVYFPLALGLGGIPEWVQWVNAFFSGYLELLTRFSLAFSQIWVVSMEGFLWGLALSPLIWALLRSRPSLRASVLLVTMILLLVLETR